MPQLDGWELAREIRAFEHELDRLPTPLLAITAAGEVAGDAAVRAAGINRVLTKPLGLKTLAEALAGVSDMGPKMDHVGLTPQRSPEDRVPAARWSKPIARLQGNEQLLMAIAEIFVEQLPAVLEQLSASAENRDFAQLARQAHLLRGQAGNFDAEGLIAATERLETAATAQDESQCVEAIQRVVTAARELQTELEAAFACS